MHAGAPESLLTVLEAQTFRVLPHMVSVTTQAFRDALAVTLSSLDLHEKPDLVLLGDILDLSFSPPDESARILTAFLQEMRIGSAFGKVAYLPGNHDHEMWTADRFGATANPGLSPGDPAFWAHTSPTFASPGAVGTTGILNRILRDAGHAGEVATYYPNMGVARPAAQAGDVPRALVLHHGHFIEGAYRLMTRILSMMTGEPMPVMTAENLEAANGSWIDFAWSTLGDAGAVGQAASLAERLMVTGGGAHALQLHLGAVLQAQLRKLLPLPHSKGIARALGYASDAMIDAFVGAYSQLERYSYGDHLTPSSRAGLVDYLAQVVAGQMRDELKMQDLTAQTTFVFGHTHKPFADRVVVPGFARPVSVYNTGGWVVDTSQVDTVEGAALVFVDDDLNTAMLRLFSVGGGGSLTEPAVVSADPTPDATNPMVQKLQKAVTANATAWERFRRNVETDIQIKQDMYLSNAERAESAYVSQRRLS
ncbi:metallophosphoesterase [Limimaricola sp.]|uniref:metallophosphoesterase n=1 Tax=Limimaricola sp. TaxID=2211665 RepID=UPI0025C4DF4C|nr:metallophosphoesterase [Limimaricola sp.]